MRPRHDLPASDADDRVYEPTDASSTQRPGHGMDDHRTVEAFRALGAPVRREMVQRLARDGRPEVPQSDLRQSTALPKSLASYHLNVLVDAGLVEARKRGRDVSYWLRRDVVEQLQREVGALLRGA